MPVFDGDPVVCAVCDTQWDADEREECPECGSTKVWDMEAAMVKAGFTEAIEGGDSE